jgi:hypothetical protein
MRRSGLQQMILASGVALALAACQTGGGAGPAPSPPGPANPGTGVSQQQPSYPPPPTMAPPPPITPAPTVAPVPPPTPAAFVTPVVAPDSPAAGAPPANMVPAQAPAPSGPPRPYQDVLRLKQAGLSDEFILNKVRTENVNYGLTTSEIVELRSAGLSEAVLEAMLRSGQPGVALSGSAVARKAEFPGISRVTRGFMGIGAKTKNVGRLVIDGDTIVFAGAEDPDQNFSVFAKNVKEIFNTCVRRPGSNLCLEVGFVTYTGEEYKFRDPGWKNGDNRLVTDLTSYFRQAFPNLFFSTRAVNEL